MVDLGDAMNLRVGCQLEYDSEADAHAVALVEPHSSIQDTILDEQWDSELPPVRFRDIYGNVCRRLDLTPGASSFAYHATVRISPEPEAMPGRARRPAPHRGAPVRAPALAPAEPPVRVRHARRSTAGSCSARRRAAPSACRRSATGSTRTSSTASPASRRRPSARCFERRGGMCRDFAHLGVTFCRALGIPARYVLRLHARHRHPRPVSRPWTSTPGSRSGWASAGGRYDARFNTPRIGRVPIGRGRDAVDVAMVTTYGDGYARAHDGLGRRDRSRARPEDQHGL